MQRYTLNKGRFTDMYRKPEELLPENGNMLDNDIEDRMKDTIKEVLSNSQCKISHELSDIKLSLSNLQSMMDHNYSKLNHQIIKIDSRLGRLESIYNVIDIFTQNMNKIAEKLEELKSPRSRLREQKSTHFPSIGAESKPTTSDTSEKTTKAQESKIINEIEGEKQSESGEDNQHFCLENSLNVYYQNVSNIRSKKKRVKVRDQVVLTNEDCIAITDTGFDKKTKIEKYFDFVNSMNIYRTDRRGKKEKDGGGVFLAIKKSIEAFEFDLSNLNSTFPSIDTVGVEIMKPNSISLCIFVVYIPDKTDVRKLSEYLRSFARLDCIKGKKCLILGDFNCPNFVIDDPLEEGLKAFVVKAFINELHLEQFNNVRNNNNRLLDLVLYGPNCPLELFRCPESSLFLKEHVDHPALLIKAYFG